MNWAWAGSIEQLWRSPNFPMWLALAAAGFFGIVVLVALWRAEKSVANGALAMIALLGIGATATVFLRNAPLETAATRGSSGTTEVVSHMQQPVLACVDDLAGETVLAACEKLLFSSPDMVAAAVSYTSNRISRLLAAGDVAAANRAMTPELERLRRAIERDRYGLVAYVLASRDHCQPAECAAYQSLTDHNVIAANMDEKLYETQVLRYAATWNGGQPPALAAAPAAAPPPTAALPPPVNIMTPEPAAGAASAPKAAAAAKPAAAPTPKPAPAAAHAPASSANAANAQAAATPPAKKPPAPPKPKPQAAAPVQLAPAPASAEE